MLPMPVNVKWLYLSANLTTSPGHSQNETVMGIGGLKTVAWTVQTLMINFQSQKTTHSFDIKFIKNITLIPSSPNKLIKALLKLSSRGIGDWRPIYIATSELDRKPATWLPQNAVMTDTCGASLAAAHVHISTFWISATTSSPTLTIKILFNKK